MDSFIWLIIKIIDIYWWIVFAMVIMSWLLAFNVVNIHNHFVRQIWELLLRLTEPLLKPIRRSLPNVGGLDISPLVLFIGLWLIRGFLARSFPAAV
jgi:YggT family protein